MKAALVTAALALLLLGLPVSVGAYEESEAPGLDARIVAVWHDPPVPEPGMQWHGSIRFAPGHNITAVSYQICDVGNACFAPPTPAIRSNESTWTFDTNDYHPPLSDRPVLWGDAAYSDGAPWRVGTQFFLTQADGNVTVVPEGEDLSSDACTGRYRECAETHYIAWDLPAGPVGADSDQGAPGPGLAILLVLLGLVAYPLRNRPGQD